MILPKIRSPKESLPVFFTGIWLAYILLSPIYWFPKGMPQPADYLVLLLGFPMLFFAVMRHRGAPSPVMIFGALFCLLTLVINLIHYAFYTDDRLLYSSLYYLFNFCIFGFGVALFTRAPQTLARLTYGAIAAGLIIQALYIYFYAPMDGYRHIGSFANPNQLAYWTLLSMAMIVALKRDKSFHLFDYALLALGLYVQTLSLSKAGLITSVLFVCAIVTFKNMTLLGRGLFFALMASFLVFWAVQPARVETFLTSLTPLSQAVARLETIGHEADDSLEARQYTRILEYPHYLAFGAGEGGLERFGTHAQEIHSGFATLLFSYGGTGLMLFLLFLFGTMRGLPARYWLMLGIVLLFSLPHQGFRFSTFWLFLSVCYTARLNFPHDERSVRAAETERIG